ncbi:transmembrane protein 185B-like isoform X1 [Varroa jacobsoni]|uniref:Transmembrane protein 185B n=2 Tax=Varroa destructor TaxID=109461 RepID=A0A7M7IZK7_VARDE|nr:transmembrane protein 185B-like isoform X1 [Varroa destructor]XP_022704651.1 transmembrane protein 185B-like isoform X1 [Varroa jacobsoni]
MTDRLLIYCSLLAFVLLLSLKWDGYVDADYWLVFSPLWLWKLVAVSSTLAASYLWHRQPQYRMDQEALLEYKAMMMCVSLHLLLLVFEVLLCDNLETPARDRHLWTVVCIPLLALCLLAIVVCIWSVKHDRPFEMELLLAVSVLQILLVALQVDRLVSWSWAAVFVPLWLLLCVALVGVLYSLIFAAILARTPEVTAEQKRLASHSAVSYTLLVLPFVAFLALLTNKLDGRSQLTFTSCSMPLAATFVVLLILSFSCKTRNAWLFGSRQDLCRLLITACPLLQEYGNISYRLHSNSHQAASASQQSQQAQQAENGQSDLVPSALTRTKPHKGSSSNTNKRQEQDGAVCPIRAIDTPD